MKLTNIITGSSLAAVTGDGHVRRAVVVAPANRQLIPLLETS